MFVNETLIFSKQSTGDFPNVTSVSNVVIKDTSTNIFLLPGCENGTQCC